MLRNPREIFKIARYGESEVFQDILNNDGNVDLNWQSAQFTTILMENACQKKLKTIELLIECGADINFKNDYKETALMWGTIPGGIEVIKLLIDRGAYVNVQDDMGMTALMDAAAEGDISIVKCLISKGADLRVKDCKLRTARIWGTKLENTHITEYLRKHKGPLSLKHTILNLIETAIIKNIENENSELIKKIKNLPQPLLQR